MSKSLKDKVRNRDICLTSGEITLGGFFVCHKVSFKVTCLVFEKVDMVLFKIWQRVYYE